MRGLNGGKRLRGGCPHPRAPGALALSLDREVEMDTQTESKNSKTRRMTAKTLRWVIPNVPGAARFSKMSRSKVVSED